MTEQIYYVNTDEGYFYKATMNAYTNWRLGKITLKAFEFFETSKKKAKERLKSKELLKSSGEDKKE